MNRFRGVIPGLVKSLDDPQGEGRILVHFPRMPGENRSFWASVAAPMAGKNRGFFFPPEKDDEVLVGFEQNSSFPYILGFLWNGVDTPPPGANQSVRRLHTVSGHILEFDDRAGDEKILIKTKGGHQLVLDDKDKKAKIELTTTGGHQFLLDDSQGQAKIELFDQKSQNTLKIDTANNAIEITSQQGSITLKAPAGTIKLEAQTLTLSASQQASLEGKTNVTVSGRQINLN